MSAIIREVTVGCARLILGDSLQVLKEISAPNIIITDPPYGIGAGTMSGGSSRLSKIKPKKWDSVAPDISNLLALNVPSIIWGGNYFDLPPSQTWLVYDKGASLRHMSFADGELAWTNLSGGVRIFTYAANQCRAEKFHRAQKPLPLMEWCLGLVSDYSGVICDPYLGSASTGVACLKADRAFIGIEKDPEYFDLAVSRMSKAAGVSVGPLFGDAA